AALGDLVTTDLPVGMLPSLSAVVDELGPHAITRLVISSPLVHAGRSQYGSVQIPDLRRIRAMAAQVFTAPGVKPNPSPVPSG
ncbi:MAG TPA: hypothetical protein VFP22_08070, partial [Candidatus Limnocylindrales bacterium]|nr:hypothetical protein [Candidatus Limnocylindrales bacterium]